MVVGVFGAGFPFVDGTPAAFGADEVFGGDLLDEHAVLVGVIAEDGETTAVAHRDGESRVREGLPPVGVRDHVTDCSLAVDGWHAPVESDAVARPAFVFAERIRGRSDEAAVRGDASALVKRRHRLPGRAFRPDRLPLASFKNGDPISFKDLRSEMMPDTRRRAIVAVLARGVLRWRMGNPSPSAKTTANSLPGPLDLRPNPSLSVQNALSDRSKDAANINQRKFDVRSTLESRMKKDLSKSATHSIRNEIQPKTLLRANKPRAGSRYRTATMTEASRVAILNVQP